MQHHRSPPVLWQIRSDFRQGDERQAKPAMSSGQYEELTQRRGAVHSDRTFEKFCTSHLKYLGLRRRLRSRDVNGIL